ncbi:MAG: hypothetical protein JW940_16295 [Polyangiaceae bacterium]|nr:hypothetical protein [Polyangiaceae bacterium]
MTRRRCSHKFTVAALAILAASCTSDNAQNSGSGGSPSVFFVMNDANDGLARMRRRNSSEIQCWNVEAFHFGHLCGRSVRLRELRARSRDAHACGASLARANTQRERKTQIDPISNIATTTLPGGSRNNDGRVDSERQPRHPLGQHAA